MLTLRMVGDVDFFRQLVGHRVGKGIEVLDHDEKGVRSADHVLPIVIGNTARRMGVGRYN